VLALFVVFFAFALASGEFSQSATFVLQPRWDQLDVDGVLIAMGQALFTIGVGMGALMAYGSYLRTNVSLVGSAAAVVLLDALVTIGAALAVVAIVFAGGVEPSNGPGMLFVTVPFAFAQLPFGALFGALLFVLIAIAAIVSGIALLEPVLVYLVEEYNAKRSRAAVSLGVICWLLGLGSVFSFSGDTHWNVLGGRNFFEAVHYIVNGWMLPLGAFGIALFVGFVLPREALLTHLRLVGSTRALTWDLWIRLIVPPAALAIFVGAALQGMR
jgi:neurotransmitter:Na+ symporter, NSS family